MSELKNTVNCEVIIWDLDGTLIDTTPGVVEAYMHLIRREKLPSRTYEELRKLSGPALQIILQNEFNLNETQTQRMVEEFRQYYMEHSIYHAAPYPGIRWMMNAIKLMGYRQAVATNKRQDLAIKLCTHFSLDQFCDLIIGSDWLGKKKKTNLIEECLEHFHTRDAVMIGDTDSDKQAAEETGIRFIGVNYGYGFRNVRGYANSAKEILDKIKAIGTIPQRTSSRKTNFLY